MMPSFIATLTLVLSATTALDMGLPSEEFAVGLAALARQDFRRAEEMFRRVVVADPSSYEAHNNLGVACAEQDRQEEATTEFRAALRLRPDYERARRNLAAVYVRLAARELLEAARRAPPSRQGALAAAARDLLLGGWQLAPSEILAHANRPEGTSETSPLATSGGTVASPSLAPPSPSPTPTHEGRELEIALEPAGAEALVIDPSRRACVRYRRDESGLTTVGEWPIVVRGQSPAESTLVVARQSATALRLFDLGTRRFADWAVEVADEAAATVTAAPNAIILEAADFVAAAPAPGSTICLVLIATDAPRLRAGGEMTEQLQARLERWRSAWANRDLASYQELYVEDFVDENGRARPAWVERKRSLFRRSEHINIRFADIALAATGDIAATRFRQDYDSALENSISVKQLSWQLFTEGWQITSEILLSIQRLQAKNE